MITKSRNVLRTLAAASVVAVALGGVAAAKPALAEGWRHDGRFERHEWREHHPLRYYGYYAPGYYYAPPVIYAPPPAASLNLIFPLDIR